MRDPRGTEPTASGLDIAFSFVLMPTFVILLGVGYYLVSESLWFLAAPLMAGVVFGVACMGLRRMQTYREVGRRLADESR